MRIATIGDIPANLAKFRDGDRLIPIRVQLDAAARADLAALEAMPVPGTAGLDGAAAGGGRMAFRQGPSWIERMTACAGW